jgi:hypothetical protein
VPFEEEVRLPCDFYALAYLPGRNYVFRKTRNQKLPLLVGWLSSFLTIRIFAQQQDTFNSVCDH